MKADKNDDFMVSFEELKECMETMDKGYYKGLVSDEQLRAYMKRFDLSQDCNLQFNEFINMIYYIKWQYRNKEIQDFVRQEWSTVGNGKEKIDVEVLANYLVDVVEDIDAQKAR